MCILPLLRLLLVLPDKQSIWRVYGGDPDTMIRQLCKATLAMSVYG